MEIKIGKWFSKWLDANEGRFRHRPLLCSRAEDGKRTEYVFQGVHPGVRLVVAGRGLFELWFVQEREVMDILGDFDVRSRYSARKGYYCADCEAWRPGKYYKTLGNLLAAHCFERLLKWANRNLTGEHRIRISLYRPAAGRYAACDIRIIKASEVKPRSKAEHGWLYSHQPVLIGRQKGADKRQKKP